jgi:hypothetical protein
VRLSFVERLFVQLFEEVFVEPRDLHTALFVVLPGQPAKEAVVLFLDLACALDALLPFRRRGIAPVHFVGSTPGFDYVALGHLHRRQQVSEDHIQYSGSLMKYSFDEAHHEKSVHLVEMDAEGGCEMERLPLTPERDPRRVEGTLSEIQERPSPDENEQDYVWVTLQDEGPVVDAMSRIREVYPNALNVEHPTRVGREYSGRAGRRPAGPKRGRGV